MRPTRKQLFSSSTARVEPNLVPSTVKFVLDRKAGKIKPLAPTEKMVVALRKVLAYMSDHDEDGCRYYIDHDQVRVTKAPSASEGKEGEARTYKAAGTCKVGVCHPRNTKTSMVVQFDLTFRDTVDDLGLADVQWIDPSTVVEIPRDSPEI